ncbi:MAG: ATP-binding cassette domain-containing protein [Bifidobacteriaceae bacterium]|jgi:D-methionine transport system ATP-binding protein|nr:ATP-binding cassette domain-containing protein [Bifidobacteriaceae bacterium]
MKKPKNNIVEFKNVSKEFTSKKNRRLAVKDVTLEIGQGEIFGIVGRSGAGKSTLIRLINGLEKADCGQVLVAGQNIVNLNYNGLKQIRKNIGFVFQHFNLFNSKTVYRNIEYPLKIADKSSKISSDDRKSRVLQLLDYVGLKEYANCHPNSLSGGQKQRVGIARALATNPQVLLADEATSALDPETTVEIMKLLKKINREFGITIILITHTISIVRLICQRVAIMSGGEIVEIDTYKNIFFNPKSQAGKSLVSTFRILEGTGAVRV